MTQKQKRIQKMANAVLPKYRITVFHPTRFQRVVLRKELQVCLEKYDGRRKEYLAVNLADVGVRDVQGINKST